MSSSLSDDLLAALVRLGFTQYEARAYYALLQQSPLNGHEVGKLAQVPPSKIYETLQRLETKGAVLVQRSEPVRYAAVPYREVLGGIRRRIESDLDLAGEQLSTLPAPREAGLVWSLRDRAAILAACQAHIEAAERSLFAAVWDEEIPELRTALEQASARGVDVHVAVYGTEALHGPVSYDLADCGESARQRLGGRRLSVVVADFRDAIITEFGTAGGDEAVVTNNAVLSLLAVEYVKSDVLGRLLIDAMGDPLYREVRENPLTKALLE
jgi:sugar-specific transcriptional regulator TrmB